MTLYEINQAIDELVANAVNEETGEINEEVYADLDALQLERNEKIEQIGLVIKNLRGEAEMVKAEKMALEKRQKNLVKAADRTADYLQAMLCGEKFSTGRLAITYRKTDSVAADKDLDLTALPEQFVRVKRELDKKELTPFLKAGNTLDGVWLESSTNMIIK